MSSRFGPQQTGGTIIEHVPPVGLLASLAQGATLLVRWATPLADKTPLKTCLLKSPSGNTSRMNLSLRPPDVPAWMVP